MKTKFIYTDATGHTVEHDKFIQPGSSGWTCRIEVGEGGLRTDNGWSRAALYNLSVKNGEWIVDSFALSANGALTNLEDYEVDLRRFGNILPNERTVCEASVWGRDTVPGIPSKGSSAGGPCEHQFETKMLFTSSYQRCCKCGVER